MPYVIQEKGLENIDCTVFLDKNDIDKGTMEQIKKMVYHHVFDNHARCRIMPDCHRSVGGWRRRFAVPRRPAVVRRRIP